MSTAHAWPGFEEALRNARDATGLTDSVTWRVVQDQEGSAVVVTGHFFFLGGSMGAEHGDQVIQAIAEARHRSCALVFVTSSGGARTQEGFTALFQMPRIMAAIAEFRTHGLPIISVYRHPTTGGVHASYGASADVVVGESGATVGFAGPRVVQAFTGTALRPGASHSAEAYLRHGLIDEIVPAGRGLDAALAWARRLRAGILTRSEVSPAPVAESYQGWDAVARARAAGRPSARRLAAFLLTDFVEIRGDRTGADDPVVVAGFGRLGGAPLALIGTDREAQRDPLSPTGSPHAAGFRKASRLVMTASRLGIPVLSLIDTRGADPTADSDNAGLASAISALTLNLVSCATPTLGVVTGEGGSGGAIAFAATDALLMQDDGVFEIIAPEGAASILYRDLARTQEVADRMDLDAASLSKRGFVDEVIAGPTSIGVFPSMALLRSTIRARLCELVALDPDRLRERRHIRFS